jgi:hypothetical protein
MEEYTKARRRAAANSTLLFCLNEYPSAPREITYAPSTSISDLSIRREMQLAEDFAFISSMKDDPNGVTAVCIEADPNAAGITMRVAINTGCPLRIVQQLQAVADIMVRTSKHGMSEGHSQVKGRVKLIHRSTKQTFLGKHQIGYFSNRSRKCATLVFCPG